MTAPAVTVRSLHESGQPLADDEKVRRLFARTLLLGEPLPFPLSGASQYQHVCLGWYLGAGRADAGLAIDEAGQVLGYALVCTDGPRPRPMVPSPLDHAGHAAARATAHVPPQP